MLAVNDTGGDGIDVDPVTDEILARRLRKRDDRRFAGAARALPPDADRPER